MTDTYFGEVDLSGWMEEVELLLLLSEAVERADLLFCYRRQAPWLLLFTLSTFSDLGYVGVHEACLALGQQQKHHDFHHELLHLHTKVYVFIQHFPRLRSHRLSPVRLWFRSPPVTMDFSDALYVLAVAKLSPCYCAQDCHCASCYHSEPLLILLSL